MKPPVFLKTTLAIAALAVVATNVPTQSHAEMYDICKLDEVPDQIQRKITRRSDYEEILGRMFDNCPDAALALTEAATASVAADKFPKYERLGDPNGPKEASVSEPEPEPEPEPDPGPEPEPDPGPEPDDGGEPPRRG